MKERVSFEQTPSERKRPAELSSWQASSYVILVGRSWVDGRKDMVWRWIGEVRDIWWQGGRLWSGISLLKRKPHRTRYSVWSKFSTGQLVVFHMFSTRQLILSPSNYLLSINSIMKQNNPLCLFHIEDHTITSSFQNQMMLRACSVGDIAYRIAWYRYMYLC